jgi:hypothetical protein
MILVHLNFDTRDLSYSEIILSPFILRKFHRKFIELNSLPFIM